MSPPVGQAAANRRGILYLSAAMVCLVLNDALMKQVGQGLGVPQMILVRGLMALLMVLAVAHALGATARLPLLANRHVLARATLDAVGTLLYLLSLMHLPLANATSINLAAPLFMALFAVVFLHERAGWPRWLAIGLGFAGVLLVIQPRAQGFNAWAVVCLAGTVCHVGRELLTRRIDPAVPAILITLASTVAVLALAAAATVVDGWQPVQPRQLGALALAAALLASGYFFIVNSMRHGELTVVAPFRYVGLLVAVGLGWAVWGEVPNGPAWAGIVLLVGTGIFLMLQGRRRAPASGVNGS